MQKVSGRISTLCSKDFPLIKKVIEFYAKKSIIYTTNVIVITLKSVREILYRKDEKNGLKNGSV